MSDHNHKRLDDAIKRRDKAQQMVQRLQGRLAAAREDVAKIEAECEERGVAPVKLEVTISQLQKRYDKAVIAFEQEIREVEGKLAPFVSKEHQ